MYVSSLVILYNNYRRSKFEELLASYTEDVEEYQEREVPRSVEEIKEHVEKLETLSKNLEDAKKMAMVREGLCI